MINTILFMAVLMALVGALGLAATMSVNVLERTREFGILQTLGGAPRVIQRIVMGEGLLIGGLSWLLAGVVTLPLSAAVGAFVGNLAFRLPLALVIAPNAVLIWLGIILVGAALATFFPAWRAARITVRQALAYE